MKRSRLQNETSLPEGLPRGEYSKRSNLPQSAETFRLLFPSLQGGEFRGAAKVSGNSSSAERKEIIPVDLGIRHDSEIIWVIDPRHRIYSRQVQELFSVWRLNEGLHVPRITPQRTSLLLNVTTSCRDEDVGSVCRSLAS